MSSPRPLPLVNLAISEAPPSLVEIVCWLIPVVGWMIAGHLGWARVQLPKHRHIVEQLRRRQEPPADAWGDRPERRFVAAVVCEEFQKEFGWPNPHYLPDDPLWLLVRRDLADAELLFALHAIKTRLKIEEKNDRLPFEYGDNATLGQFVDVLTSAHVRGPASPWRDGSANRASMPTPP